MKRINKRAAAKQIGESDRCESQPQPASTQECSSVGTAPASTGTEAASVIGMSTGHTDGAGTGVAGKSATNKDQGSATDQNDECDETSIVPVPIAPMADAPEPIVLPPAIELAAIEPVLLPTQVDYSKLDINALDAAIVKSLEIAGHYAKQFDAEKKAHLLPALMEMEKHWDKKQGARSDLSQLPIYGKWHDYLRHRGVKPSTYRGWKRGYYDALALASPQLGEESASLPNSDVLTSVQEEVVSALVGQGYRQRDARELVRSTEGATFDDLFRNALANRLKPGDRQKQPALPTVPPVEQEAKPATPAKPAPVTPPVGSEPKPTKPAEPAPVTAEPVEPESGGRLVPDETPTEPDNEHEALLLAAKRAALAAVSGVTGADIKSRYCVIMIVFSHRNSLNFAKYLKTVRDIKPEKIWCSTCFKPHPTEITYKTYEEAWAYAKAYAGVLEGAGLDVCYGVVFQNDDYVSKRNSSNQATLILRNDKISPG